MNPQDAREPLGNGLRQDEPLSPEERAEIWRAAMMPYGSAPAADRQAVALNRWDELTPEERETELLSSMERLHDEAEADARRLAAAAKATKPPKPKWRDHAFTAASLRLKTFPEIRYVIPGLLPEGLAMLAGRPKIGKSWAALDIALAVASEDGTCLGLPDDAAIYRGAVLYVAAEDSDRRLQKRITKLIGINKQPWPERLMLTTQWRKLDKGGVADIAEWIATTPDARLVILDTLAAVRPQRDRDSYATDYAALGDLHRLINDKGLAGLVLHHTRKAEATEDWVDGISGTLGLAGVIDTPIVLQGGSNGMTLCVRGRDIEEAEHAIVFDKATARWQIKGPAADVHRSDTRSKILAALQPIYPNTLGPSDIAAATGIKETVVKTQLQRMLVANEVTKTQRGLYSAPPTVTS